MGTMAFAQKGEIIYRDFEPDSTQTFLGHDSPYWWGNDLLWLDLDMDGTNEWLFYSDHPWGHFLDLNFAYNWWTFGVSGPDNPYESTSIGPIDDPHFPQYGDSLPGLFFSYSDKTYEWFCINNPSDHYFEPHYLGIRKRVGEGEYCYGWIELSVYIHTKVVGETIRQTIDLTVYRTAYCTIPNYPLCVGQTGFDWVSTEEVKDLCVKIQPNPTNGQIAIMGKELKFAVVYNAIGQHVATKTGEGNQLIVDLNGQPAGVYFVNVTDQEGRKCVHKVVKQ